MTERTRVDQLVPGAQFRLLADWRSDGTGEVVPATDVLTALELTTEGDIVHIATEVGTISLETEDYVDVVAPTT